MSNAQRFIVAFNEVENYFRRILQIGSEEKDFTALLIEYEGAHRLLSTEPFDLRRFNDLRNAIVHGLYSSRAGRPIAEPRPDIVVAIERLRDRLVRPSLVSTIFQQQKVVEFNSDKPVSSPLRAVRDFDYSQFPIYKEGKYFKLLTTNCIARWLASQFDTDGAMAATESVENVLKYSEGERDRGRLCKRHITVRDAIEQLAPSKPGTMPPRALIITNSGLDNDSDSPLAIIVRDDLPVLMREDS